MGKFINVPLPLYSVTADMASPAIAGTTSGAATGKLTYATGGFNAAVNVGDQVLDTTTWTISTVTAVDSDTVLSISGTGNAALQASGAAFKIWPYANAYAFLISTGTFLTDVNVGDLVINTSTGRMAKVAKVNSDTSLTMDNFIFDDNGSDNAVVISQSGYGGRLISLDNIVTNTPTAGGVGTTPVVLTYKTKTAGNDNYRSQYGRQIYHPQTDRTDRADGPNWKLCARVKGCNRDCGPYLYQGGCLR